MSSIISSRAKYLLDTCVISDFVKGEAGTLKMFKAMQPADIAISAITKFEIDYGLALNPARSKKIKPLIISILKSIQIIDFKQNHGQHAAHVRAELKQQGLPIGPYDLLIAGTALAYNMTLVSANYNEFSRVNDLVVINWRDV